MSNKNTEYERKFLLNLRQLNYFENALNYAEPREVETIVQMYMLTEYGMCVTFDESEDVWVVTNKESNISLRIPVVTTDLLDLKETLGKYPEHKDNLIEIEGSAIRVRFTTRKDGSNHAYFTMKIKEGDKEFQDEIIDDDLFIASHRLMGAWEGYTLSKERHTHDYKGHSYEIDFFDHDALIILEIEFPTKEDSENFFVWFEFEKELTGILEYSNKYMATNKPKK